MAQSQPQWHLTAVIESGAQSGISSRLEAEDAVVIPKLNLTLLLAQICEEAGVAPMKAGFAAEM
ncbi:hypothetical protein ACFST9_06560 [Hymenobacter monticola]|uniref:Uncharacterized protein n=1 Tax=Hymenobacter monticola TaxID=1705399 RepID=A0ABY4BAT1_9BACT|nr:hypothetical protein [Hymenobacter monticola]UOE36277.1 hypothetical protein MTP16_11680 [Hymenobacter monticola]